MLKLLSRADDSDLFSSFSLNLNIETLVHPDFIEFDKSLRTGSRGTIVIEDIEVGMVRTLMKEVTTRDIELFAEVSTDRNPVHLDDAYAADTIFGGRIAHGMLTAGLISAVIGEQLPGHGTVYLGQTLKFLAPVRPGDTVEEGQTILIIEAMKTMNQIPAPRSGKVRTVLVENAEPVEFGEPLLIIE